tara:strand:- start:364 stop:1059 length:696 start_codon:yes stop_codon:yes gene_type:complete
MKKFYDKSELDIPHHTPDQKEFYFRRCAEFDKAQIGYDKIVFLGDSITEGGGNWNNYFGTKNIVNRGISGDTTLGVLTRLHEIWFYKPISLFLLIGINDIFSTDSPNRKNITPLSVSNNIITIAKMIYKKSPNTQVYIQTTLPINPKLYKETFGTFPVHKMPLPDQINHINTRLKKNESQNHYTVIDLHDIFLDGRGLLSKKHTSDGVHLNEEGYHKWSNFIKNYISSNFL